MANKTAWISDTTTEKKPWGEISPWNSVGHSCNKILKIQKGHRTSLKKYSIKDETFYLLSGKLSVVYGNEHSIGSTDMSTGELTEGQVLTVPAGCPYRLEAIVDSIVIESSNNNQSSVKILEDDYNR
jgi:mannose-6-phosphate isomerase-like protein (cupin superfamily)